MSILEWEPSPEVTEVFETDVKRSSYQQLNAGNLPRVNMIFKAGDYFDIVGLASSPRAHVQTLIGTGQNQIRSH